MGDLIENIRKDTDILIEMLSRKCIAIIVPHRSNIPTILHALKPISTDNNFSKKYIKIDNVWVWIVLSSQAEERLCGIYLNKIINYGYTETSGFMLYFGNIREKTKTIYNYTPETLLEEIKKIIVEMQ